MELVREGVVNALAKLIGVESVQAHRLVSGCLANLTTTREVTFELLRANGHKVRWWLMRKRRVPTTFYKDVAGAHEGGGYRIFALSVKRYGAGST